jgi:hypothetical protein
MHQKVTAFERKEIYPHELIAVMELPSLQT